MTQEAATLAVDLQAIEEARDQLPSTSVVRAKLNRILARYGKLPPLRAAAEDVYAALKHLVHGLPEDGKRALTVLGAVLEQDQEALNDEALAEAPIHPMPISLGHLEGLLRDDERELALALARHTGYIPTVTYEGEGDALRDVRVTFVYRSKSGEQITRSVSEPHGPKAQWLLLALRKAWRDARLDHVEDSRVGK